MYIYIYRCVWFVWVIYTFKLHRARLSCIELAIFFCNRCIGSVRTVHIYIYTQIDVCAWNISPYQTSKLWLPWCHPLWPSGSSDALGKRWAKTARARGDSVTPRSWNGTDVWQLYHQESSSNRIPTTVLYILIKHITVHTVYYSMHLHAKMPFPWEGLTLTPRASVVVLADWQLFQHEVQKQKRLNSSKKYLH